MNTCLNIRRPSDFHKYHFLRNYTSCSLLLVIPVLTVHFYSFLLCFIRSTFLCKNASIKDLIARRPMCVCCWVGKRECTVRIRRKKWLKHWLKIDKIQTDKWRCKRTCHSTRVKMSGKTTVLFETNWISYCMWRRSMEVFHQRRHN